jgi:hypothetical protein
VEKPPDLFSLVGRDFEVTGGGGREDGFKGKRIVVEEKDILIPE